MSVMPSLKPLKIIPLLLAVSWACEDATPPDFPDPIVRLRDMGMEGSIQTSNGEGGESSSMSSGGAESMAGMVSTVGGSVSGMESGGMDITSGTLAGSTDNAGTTGEPVNGGSMTGGTPGSSGGLSCNEILACFETCAEGDQACANTCATQGSPAGVSALNALAECDQTWSCNGNGTCLGSYCSAELQACGISAPPPAGGTEPGGSPGGGVAQRELGCIEILECFGACPPEDSLCIDDCIDQGSSEGVAALSALAGCDQTAMCAGDPTCLSASCDAELTRCETGSEPPPVNPVGDQLTCPDVLVCFEGCMVGDQACGDACVMRASPTALVALSQIIACSEDNMCEDEVCINTNCTVELDACAADGQPGGGPECLTFLDCPFTQTCANGVCVDCATDFDCGFGLECVANVCVPPTPTECTPDLYEPNNTAEAATSTTLSGLIAPDEELTLCGDDEDHYALELCSNGTVSATITFDSLSVDIDFELTLAGEILPETSSAGVSDTETVSFTNIGTEPQALTLRVFVYGSAFNEASDYTMSITISDCP